MSEVKRIYHSFKYIWGSVNYHEVLGIDAHWAEQIIERGDGYATVPTNIVLVNLPKQHLIMQTMVKKMLHNMLPIPLFISTAAIESLISTSFPRCLLERDGNARSR